MVWFQCEDCGENLKKPKLLNHLSICSANNLSCIDCGVIFGRQSVLAHTQCITEAEKYGPKGQDKGSQISSTKSKKDDAKEKQKSDVDTSVGLSEHPPWFCSICNTKATSKQALLLHADGKKHRAKARAHAAKQQSSPNEESTPNKHLVIADVPKDESFRTQDAGRVKDKNVLEPSISENCSEGNDANLHVKKNKKRKVRYPLGELGNEEVTPNGEAETHGTKKRSAKKVKHNEPKESKVVENNSPKKDDNKKVKWKELITTALKSTPDGKLKMRKLRKRILKAMNMKAFGVNNEENQFGKLLESKILSSSRFTIVDKYVHLNH